MKLLTRTEEYVLLAVWRLQDDAYSVPIRKELSRLTGKKWSLGSVYMPLERLTHREMLTSSLHDGDPDRGGRPRRIYALTRRGREALLHIHSVQSAMWKGVTPLALEEGR